MKAHWIDTFDDNEEEKKSYEGNSNHNRYKGRFGKDK